MFTNRIALFALAALLISGCAASSHDVVSSDLGTPVGSDYMIGLAPAPGEVRVTAIESAHWQVDRAGLINLDHARAEAAGLESGPEPILVNFYVIEHPTHGTFLVDSGMATGFRDEDTAPVSALVASQLDFSVLDIKTSTGEWLAQHGPIDGVFLTHIHIDHTSGLPDVPKDVPIWVGPGESKDRAFMNMFTQGTVDGFLDGKSPLREWQFTADPDESFEGVLDVFGDGSLFAIHAPGHTVGSTAFLARTPDGPVLMVGDVSHTNWGWNHCVEPGEFSNDIPKSVESLVRIKRLEKSIPGLVVHLGHQHQDGPAGSCADQPQHAHAE